MKIEDQTFEAYFSGRMSSAEASDFTVALKNNDKLRNEYEYFLAIKKSTNLIERDNLRTALDGLDLKELKTTEKPKSRSSKPILTFTKWAAGIAAVLLIAFFSYTSLKPLDPQSLYAQNYETYEAQASRGGSLDILKEQYIAGDFEKFIENALEAEESPELTMMLGNAYMETNQFPKAIETLTKISDDTSLRDQKYWYLGLCTLKEDRSQEALNNFNKLMAISNYKKVESEKIISFISKKIKSH